MKKLLCLHILLLGVVNTFAQAALDKLVQAENTFAEATRAPGSMKQSFLHVLDSAALVFDEGQPHNAVAAYSSFPDTGSAMLHWWPVIAAVSADGQLGYTSGPFTFSMPGAKGGAPFKTNGYYFSVWKQDDHQTFKLLLDGGTMIPADWDTAAPKITDGNGIVTTATAAQDKRSFEQAIQVFAQQAANNAPAAYKHFLAATPYVLHNGHSPTYERNAALQGITAATMETTDEHHALAASQDFGYSFGQSGKMFFIRIWIYENNHWKILAEILSA